LVSLKKRKENINKIINNSIIKFIPDWTSLSQNSPTSINKSLNKKEELLFLKKI
jgi:hypothetical protein